MDYVCLTLSVDNLIDFMRVIRILGIVLYHLEAHREVVQSASEVGFPPGLVVGELVDFTTCYCPRLSDREGTFIYWEICTFTVKHK